MDKRDHINKSASSVNNNHGVHLCHKCGWAFTKLHPSAKHRRAHKKVCGTIEGYKLIASDPNLSVSDDDKALSDEDCPTPSPITEKRSVKLLGSRSGVGSMSNKSEDDMFVDAVTEFTDSGGNNPVMEKLLKTDLNESNLLKVDAIVDTSVPLNDTKEKSEEVLEVAKEHLEKDKLSHGIVDDDVSNLELNLKETSGKQTSDLLEDNVAALAKPCTDMEMADLAQDIGDNVEDGKEKMQESIIADLKEKKDEDNATTEGSSEDLNASKHGLNDISGETLSVPEIKTQMFQTDESDDPLKACDSSEDAKLDISDIKSDVISKLADFSAPKTETQNIQTEVSYEDVVHSVHSEDSLEVKETIKACEVEDANNDEMNKTEKSILPRNEDSKEELLANKKTILEHGDQIIGSEDIRNQDQESAKVETLDIAKSEITQVSGGENFIKNTDDQLPSKETLLEAEPLHVESGLVNKISPTFQVQTAPKFDDEPSQGKSEYKVDDKYEGVSANVISVASNTQAESSGANLGSVSDIKVTTDAGSLSSQNGASEIQKPEFELNNELEGKKKQRNPLKNLLVEEAKSPNSKQGGAVTTTTTTVNAILSSEEGNDEKEMISNNRDWNSPARYPTTEIKKQKRKGKPYWVPFVCCSSGHWDS